MKELSTEEKAKRYDEAIGRARTEYKNHEAFKGFCEMLVNIFPELEESEDERIRKTLRKRIIRYDPNNEILIKEEGISQKQFLAWLEKQGESDETKAKAFLIKKGYPIDANDVFPTYEEMYNIIREGLEQQGEQKPVDKVESKFNVYDWVVTDKGDTVQIGAVNNGYYTLFNGMDFNMSYVDKCWHKWTIEDAKEGDVLSYATDEEALWIMIYWSLYEPYEGHVHYYALLVNDDFTGKGTCCICIDNLKPATKEQRDKLEKAMLKAGYRWNTEECKPEKI